MKGEDERMQEGERIRLTGRSIYPRIGQGQALVTKMNISFFVGVDPESGLVLERDHELQRQSLAGVVLVFSAGKGSTVGSYTLYRLKKAGLAPAAIVDIECKTITAVGCIIAEIPCVDQVTIERIPSGMMVVVDGNSGSVEVQFR